MTRATGQGKYMSSWQAGILFLVILYVGWPIRAIGNNVPAQAETAGQRIIATVNGTAIFQDQLDREVASKMHQYKRMGMHSVGSEQEQASRKALLNGLVDQELLSQASRAMVIPDIENRVRLELENIKKHFGSSEDLDKYFKSKNLTEEDFLSVTRNNIYLDAYLQAKALDKPEISEEDIRAFYAKGAGFVRDESVRVRHILVALEKDASSIKQEAQKNKIEEVRRLVTDGKDFAELTKEYSDCLRSKNAGGDLGFITKGFMPKEFDEVAFSMQKDEVSGVIVTQFGYHLLKLEEKQPAGRIPYENVRDFIKQYLQSEKRPKQIALHIHELKKTAQIEILMN